MNTRFRLASAVALGTVAVLFALSGSTANGQPAQGPPLVAARLTPPPLQNQPLAENSYVPITPCRIVDTRIGNDVYGTPISNLQTRYFVVAGTLGFGSQGGKSGGCGILEGAVAVTATLLVVGPSNTGRLHAWPNGVAEPTATTFY